MISTKILFKNDDAVIEIVTIVRASPYFFSLDNYLHYMDAPKKPATHLWLTANQYLLTK